MAAAPLLTVAFLVATRVRKRWVPPPHRLVRHVSIHAAVLKVLQALRAVIATRFLPETAAENSVRNELMPAE